MALTGLCWSFNWYKNGLGAVLGVEVFGGRGGKPAAEIAETATPPLSYTALMEAANKACLIQAIIVLAHQTRMWQLSA